ncbi:hypothetical protein M404DRAFT_174612 [Pisolithus tinctorius Marx 270]|uniref:Uncharacterized protein n=1 Tax=Pisolithus tinctorius Marx 270 TaxID=870435 RepID=A0A0C3PYW5_PISTI|nr:hypothetical protein M404DRAFT_174612 [Pisolithus tinctorius Marx 270]
MFNLIVRTSDPVRVPSVHAKRKPIFLSLVDFFSCLLWNPRIIGNSHRTCMRKDQPKSARNKTST